jgi:hypothetical protein
MSIDKDLNLLKLGTKNLQNEHYRHLTSQINLIFIFENKKVDNKQIGIDSWQKKFFF